MRIWIVHQHAIPPNFMGPTRHFDLAKKLIDLGHEVYILAGNYCHTTHLYIAEPYSLTKKITYYDKVPFIWFKTPAYVKNSFQKLWSMLVFAFKVMQSKDLNYLPGPDVILGSSPSPFAAFAAKKIAKHFKVPFIYEIRDLWPETLVNLGNFSKYNPLIKLMQGIENTLLAKAKIVISVLPGVKEYLQSKQIQTEKFIWLPNAVDFDKAIYRSPIVKNTIDVMYAGSFNISNDVYTIVQAAKILQQKNNNKIRISLMGEGPLKSQIKAAIHLEKLQNICFIPTVNKEKVYELLAKADIFVGMVKNKDLYNWGTSLNKIIDYLATARPIIFGINSPYNPISEAEAGLTIPPENPEALVNALLTLAELPPEKRQQLGLNGRKYAEKFHDMRNIAKSLLKAL